MESIICTNTRAYKESERRRLISGTVGRGTFVSADVTTITSLTRPETIVSNNLEMGLVLPLYGIEPDLTEKFAQFTLVNNLIEYLKYTRRISRDKPDFIKKNLLHPIFRQAKLAFSEYESKYNVSKNKTPEFMTIGGIIHLKPKLGPFKSFFRNRQCPEPNQRLTFPKHNRLW